MTILALHHLFIRKNRRKGFILVTRHTSEHIDKPYHNKPSAYQKVQERDDKSYWIRRELGKLIVWKEIS